MSMWWGKQSVNEAVLAELREIRVEIHALTEQLGKAATREDLKGYVTQASFDHHSNRTTRALRTGGHGCLGLSWWY